jgi:hypothetical protein
VVILKPLRFVKERAGIEVRRRGGKRNSLIGWIKKISGIIRADRGCGSRSGTPGRGQAAQAAKAPVVMQDRDAPWQRK